VAAVVPCLSVVACGGDDTDNVIDGGGVDVTAQDRGSGNDVTQGDRSIDATGVSDASANDAALDTTLGNDSATVDASDSSGGKDSGSDAVIDSASSTGNDSGVDAGMDSAADDAADAGPDGSVVTPPSCAPGGAGMTNCGGGGDGGGSESCCTSPSVAGGTYYRTYANSGSGPTSEADPATVSGFRLDKYLVTVGRFRQFVTAWNGGSGYTPPAGSGKHTHLNGGRGLENSGSAGTYETGWLTSDNGNIAPTNANLSGGSSGYQTWTNNPGSQETLPINYVNWFEAYAFCIWDGGFLPSEAEWEYVAAGGSEQREYPWGSTAPGTACPGTGCQYAIYGGYYPNGSGICSSVSVVAPVGTATLGAALWGQLDMAGEMWEWNVDVYAFYRNPCADCAYLTVASSRMTRGGGACNTASYLLPWSRGIGTPTDRQGGQGFRCARTP